MVFLNSTGPFQKRPFEPQLIQGLADATLDHPLAARPGPGVLDRLTRTGVARAHRLEQGQRVLGARCGPEREKVVVLVGQGPAPAQRDEARIPNLREDHRTTPCSRRVVSSA